MVRQQATHSKTAVSIRIRESTHTHSRLHLKNLACDLCFKVVLLISSALAFVDQPDTDEPVLHCCARSTQGLNKGSSRQGLISILALYAERSAQQSTLLTVIRSTKTTGTRVCPTEHCMRSAKAPAVIPCGGDHLELLMQHFRHEVDGCDPYCSYERCGFVRRSTG